MLCGGAVGVWSWRWTAVVSRSEGRARWWVLEFVPRGREEALLRLSQQRAAAGALGRAGRPTVLWYHLSWVSVCWDNGRLCRDREEK